jgi:hypothetical protein
LAAVGSRGEAPLRRPGSTVSVTAQNSL